MRKILIALAASMAPLVACADNQTQIQWGIDKNVSPYPFGMKIGPSWFNLGTVDASGNYRLAPKSVAATDYIRNDSSAPSIAIPFGDTTGGYVWTPFYLGTVASHNLDADSGGIVSLLSSTGYSGLPYLNWKAGFQVFATGQDGTSNLWGINPACSLAANESHGVGCVAVEADLNLYNRNYNGIPATAAGPWAAGVVATGGGGGFYGHAAFVASGGNTTTWNYGLLFADYTNVASKLINSADIYSNTKAPYFLQDTGTKNYGLALNGTYAGFAIGIPNNAVVSAVQAGGGGAYDTLFYYDTGNRLRVPPRTIFGNLVQLGAFYVGTIPACTASTNANYATVLDGVDFNGYGLAGGYGSAYTGTGLVTRVVICTNRAGPTTWAWVYN